MSVELQSQKIISMRFTEDKLQLLKNTVCKGCTDDELELFIHVCSKTGLDPFAKQIHAIPRRSKDKSGQWIHNMTIQTGIDGFRLIAERTGKYSPGREPTFTYDEQGKLVSATAYLKKLTMDGTWHDVSATAFWAEYVQASYDGTPTKFWKQMPHGQLAKCAESLALRKAFPADFSGLYTHEEMAQASKEENIDTIEVSKVEQIKESVVEISEEELVDTYVSENWEGQEDSFREFMKKKMEVCKWTAGRFIQYCRDKKNTERLKEAYTQWMESNKK